MDAGALELQLRRLPGVVACQLTAGEVVLLLGAGDPAAVRIAAQAALDQAGSDRRIRVLAAPPAAPVAVWRRRRFAVFAGAAGALSAGIAAASTLASMPGAVSPSRDVAIAVPEPESPGGRQGVRTLVPAAEGASADEALPIEAPRAEVAAIADPARVATPVPTLAAAGTVVDVPAPAAPSATPTAAPPPPPPAPAARPVSPEAGVVAAASDEDDDRSGRRRGRDGRPPHPHGEPPGHLRRAGHGPW